VRRFLSALLLLVGLAYPSLGQSTPDKAVLALETQLVEILNTKNTTGFLSLIASSGVTFGIDGDNQFKEQVQEQFEQKRAAYCVLFDSKCLSRTTPTRKREVLRPCSAHDLVGRANGWSMEHQTGEYGGRSQIHLILKPNNEYCLNGKDPIEFVFTEFTDGWKLVAVGYE
jgi:hypothetical protein